MKKLLIILLLALTFCKEKPKEHTQVTKDVKDAVETINKALENGSTTHFNLLNTVFKNLTIKKENCKTNLITTEVNAHNPEETFVVIPEIANLGGSYVELNSHILIVDNKTGDIKQRYFESHQTNDWISDALEFKEIRINSKPNFIKNNSGVFGIETFFYGSSQVNPYSNERVSLFIKKGDSLQKILHNFDLLKFGGEYQNHCEGEFLKEHKTLIKSKEETNGYPHILVKNKITETKNIEDKEGNCKEKKTTTLKTTVLKFNGVEYQSYKNKNLRFDKIMEDIPIKNIPLVNATNFDNFSRSKFYNEEEVLSLQLEKIYPDYYKKGQPHKSVSSYKIKLAKNYNTIVFTTYLGDQEIETVLANYDYHRNLIDYEVIAYDEIGESAYSVKSNIGFTTLTVIHRSIYEAKDEVQNYTFEENGKITQIIPTNSTISLSKTKLIHSVITQLGLDKSDIKTSLITVKILPRNPLETIVVIPQIVDQGEHYFELNSYIVIANSITGKITHKYFESAETNSWTSAAIELREIKIDTAAYLIKENTSAFGIRVYYVGMSRANPYSNETISLFEKSDNKLIKVLNTYLIMTNTGEWDTNCAGEFSETKNRLIMSKEKSNNYFDIKVKSKIVTSKNYVDKNGECDIKDSITNKTETLKYNGKAYKLKSDK